MKTKFIVYFMALFCFVKSEGVLFANSSSEKLAGVIPSHFIPLFSWPDQAVLEGPKRMSSNKVEVAFPTQMSLTWISNVLDAAWRPPAGTELYCLQNEFDDGRDVVRVAWNANGYRVEVSQTAWLFALKLIPQKGVPAGAIPVDKRETARSLCFKIFNSEGYRWDRQGEKILITDLARKIAAYSFYTNALQPASAGDIMSGMGRTMAEAGVERNGKGVNGRPWEETAQAWDYWFRNVGWWCDGEQTGFWFPKIQSGPVMFPFGNGRIHVPSSFDTNWFRLPHDRMGRPIAPQNK